MTTESRFKVGDKVRRIKYNNGDLGGAVGDTAVVLAEGRGEIGGWDWLDVRLDKNDRSLRWSAAYAELVEPPVSAQVAELEAALEDARHRQAAAEQQADKLRSQVHELQRDHPPLTHAEASRIVGQVFDVLTGKIKAPNGQRDYTIPVYELGSIYEHDGWRNYPSGVRTVRVSW
jgi:hypothetical protein